MTDAPWWTRATGYQIYPRSFADGNGDGIGDIPGIISKLDHLEALGIGFIWLSPIYASPMRDNGYDISDYRAIAPEFGTLEDIDRLIAEAGKRGIRIVMDLVVNHCSSDHGWFKAACASREACEHDFFYWRDPGPGNGPPDDQRAIFGGSAWIWVEEVGQYYYGHFGPQQPDLNWQNPALRREIWDMMNWWLDRGIGGFRMDVIDLIGKDLETRDYDEGPYLWDFLDEMKRECLAGRDILTVGETWSATPETVLKYCGKDGALDMVFGFNHIKVAWDEEEGRYGPNLFDLVTHKKIHAAWQKTLTDDGWNSLYLSNHDLPRPVSFYGDDGACRVQSAKMLAVVTHLMKGTPYIYQGEELGMTNIRFERLEQFRDIEVFGHWADHEPEGMTLEALIAGANANGRDNARTPMQWTAGPEAGFTTGTPWIEVNANHTEINAEAERADPDGIFAFYGALIALRREADIVTEGDFTLHLPEHPDLFAYERMLGAERLFVVGSFSGAPVELPAGCVPEGAWELVLSNSEAPDPVAGAMLPPWFTGVWRLSGS